MRKRTLKGAALAALLGSLLGFGGCLDTWWGRIVVDTALYAGQEYLFDNDAVFDLFEDGAGVAQE
jgi:hypothetical protein